MRPAKTQIRLRSSLMWVFADRMCLLQPPGYSNRNKREPLLCWVGEQNDLSLCCSHVLLKVLSCAGSYVKSVSLKAASISKRSFPLNRLHIFRMVSKRKFGRAIQSSERYWRRDYGFVSCFCDEFLSTPTILIFAIALEALYQRSWTGPLLFSMDCSMVL